MDRLLPCWSTALDEQLLLLLPSRRPAVDRLHSSTGHQVISSNPGEKDENSQFMNEQQQAQP
jgi:hypothetical protein